MRLEDLTEEELRVIHDPEDRFFISLIKGCSQEELREFDKYKPINLHHYAEIQKPWIEEDRYLLGIKINHEPTEMEFCDDYVRTTHNAERFRAYYVLKYHHMVERIK